MDQITRPVIAIKLMLATFAYCLLWLLARLLLWLLVVGVFITLGVLVPAAIIYFVYLIYVGTNSDMGKVVVIAVCGFALIEVWYLMWTALSPMVKKA